MGMILSLKKSSSVPADVTWKKGGGYRLTVQNKFPMVILSMYGG
jgi:hypothetical protein